MKKKVVIAVAGMLSLFLAVWGERDHDGEHTREGPAPPADPDRLRVLNFLGVEGFLAGQVRGSYWHCRHGTGRSLCHRFREQPD